jgi:hypothetical protein
VRAGQAQGRYGIGAEEVDQVRGTAQRGRFQARYTARAEVVQLERQLPCGSSLVCCRNAAMVCRAS